MALSDTEIKAIKELYSILLRRHTVLDFRIYGSKATGNDVPGSDIDVMIILEQTSPAIESEIDDLVFDINLKYGCFSSILFFSRQELEEGPLAESPIYKKAVSQGITI